MIFSVGDHIMQIIAGTKTQTRRRSGGYIVGKTYSIQPGRTKLGIPEGRIRIMKKVVETRTYDRIDPYDSEAEGGYCPIKFEELYARMHPHWTERYAYTFIFIPTEEGTT